MVEVLKIFGIATKEIRRGLASQFPMGCVSNLTELRVERFLRKLAGMVDLEDALKKLDRLTQEEARMALSEVLGITHSVRDEVKVVDGKVDDIICSWSPDLPIPRCSLLNPPPGNQLKQLLRMWLSPVDPSINHNIARKAQYKGTAVWLFQGSLFIEWKSTGSLLWIHGKRVFPSLFVGRAPSDRLRLW